MGGYPSDQLSQIKMRNRAFHSAGLLEATVAHLYLAQLVRGIATHVNIAHRLVGKTRHKPLVVPWVRCGVGAELLHIGISEGSLISLRSLNKLLLPLVSALNSLVLHHAFGPHGLKSSIAFQPWGISQGLHWLRGLEGSLGSSIMTKVIVASDTLDDISAGQLDVGHTVVVNCDTWSIQIGFSLLDFIPIVVLHHGPLHPVHDGDGVLGDTLLVGLLFLKGHLTVPALFTDKPASCPLTQSLLG